MLDVDRLIIIIRRETFFETLSEIAFEMFIAERKTQRVENDGRFGKKRRQCCAHGRKIFFDVCA